MRPRNPFIYNAPVPPDRFIGRAHEVDQILGQLANPARSCSAISGDPRVGKTSLLHHLSAHQVREAWGLSPTWCHFLYLDCHSVVPFSDEAFWRYTLRELERHLSDDEVLSGHVQELLEQASPDIYDLNSLFDEIARASRLAVLMMDEFEGVIENLDRNSPTLLYHLRALLNRPDRGLALLVATRRSLEQLCAGFRFAGSPFDNCFSAITLPPFSETEVDELLDRYGVRFSPSERAYLRQMAGTHPYLVQRAASLIVRMRGEHIAEEATLAQIEADLEGRAKGYFSDMFSYSSERQKMLLAWLALYQLGQQLPADRVRLGDMAGIFGHYDHEIAHLVKRGLVLYQPDGPTLFSPIFGRWLLRQVIIAGGREVLSDWEPYYINSLSLAQKEALQDVIDKVIRWPAIVKKPESLAQVSAEEEASLLSVSAGKQVLGRYIIEELIGGGGMADVFKARDPHLDRPVAIKKLRATLSEAEEVRARFQREARAIAALRHPHIVRVYDLDIQSSHYYMVMEFIEGHDLREYLHNRQAAGQTMPWEEILRIAAHVADALDYAHQRGMLHRDVKPANVLLANDGGVFLTDFGLVRLLDQPGLTQDGRLIGTLAYMAPEQVLGESQDVDHRADIYGLGCIVYEMVTGRPPFESADFPLAHLDTDPIPPDRLVPDLPKVASQVILKALAKDPVERPASASQFIQDLRRALSVRHSIRLGGAISLPDEHKAVIRQLYAETSQPLIGQVHIHTQFHGGLSGAHVVLGQPIDDRGRGMAPEVIKIGPATMLRREYDRYRRFVKGRLPMTAVTLERGPVELGVLACLSYGFVGDQPFGTVQDLETYYVTHNADEVTETLVRLMKPLDARWYGQSEPLVASFADEYDQRLPAHLRLLAESISPSADFSPGSYRLIDVETILGAGERLEVGERVAIPDLRISQVKPDTVKLHSADNGPVVWVRASITAPRTDLGEGDRVGILGVVKARRDDVFSTATKSALDITSAIMRQPDGTLRLEGLEHLCPDPLSIYQQALNQQLNGRCSIIHGDLHPGNILVDESGRGWLLDFDHVREGHVLFDFIRLETFVRLFVLGGVRRLRGEDTSSTAPWPHAFTLAEYISFEAALAQQPLDQPAEPVANPDLTKATQVILATRRLARRYLRFSDDWSEYLIGLFLHNLAQLRFYEDQPQLGILPFTTAAVVGGEVSKLID